jgi:transcriptional regulator with XRE-family HTH domain
MSSFAENLKRIRLDRQMSQEEFARFLQTSKQNISRYESGAVSPKISTASRIADLLGVSLSELNGDDENAETHPIPSSAVPQTEEARILCPGIDSMPPEDRKRALEMMKLMFDKYF